VKAVEVIEEAIDISSKFNDGDVIRDLLVLSETYFYCGDLDMVWTVLMEASQVGRKFRSKDKSLNAFALKAIAESMEAYGFDSEADFIFDEHLVYVSNSFGR
jgi:hypothetical protein